MKISVFRSVFFALVCLVLSPLALAYASPAPAASLLPFAYQQGPRPVAKRLAEPAPPNTEDFLIRAPSQAVRETFGLTSFYQQWIDVQGFPVVASENVNPYAVKEAAWLIGQLMSHRPDVLQAMVQNRASFSVIAYNEMLTQIPEYAYLRPSFFWDRRARGLGGRESSCGEENLLNYPGDPYAGYNVLIHEFSHSVHKYGLNAVEPDFDDRLRKAFDAALAEGLWKGTYASTNKDEYWAESVQVWFNAHFGFFDINTRAELKNYDPALAKLIAEVFGDTDWQYTRPATRIHLPHLQGFEPPDSPTFAWPPELVAYFKQLFEPDGDGGDKWVNLTLYDPSQLSQLRSPSNETDETEIVLINSSDAPITYYWIAPDGTERYYSRLAFGYYVIRTFVDHIWLIKDQYDNDLVVLRAEEKTGRAFIGSDQVNAPTATADAEAPPTLKKTSGDEQQGLVSAALAEPFVVSVLDENGAAFAGAVVTFSVTAGGGTLSAVTVSTDANGRASSTLTLGSELGTNTVVAAVAGLGTETFTATALGQIPHSLIKVSGDGQEGLAGAQLAAPFVALVLDEDDEAIAGAVVRFFVTAGGGKLLSPTAITDTNGLARNFLRLGLDSGPNTVVAMVSNVDKVLAFTATGKDSEYSGFDDFFGNGKPVARPDRTRLLQNAPNPFNSETVLAYFLLKPGPVRLEVFALSGQRVAVLHQGPQQAGYHRLHWDGRDAAGRPVASGAYLYRLVTDEVVLKRKLILLR